MSDAPNNPSPELCRANEIQRRASEFVLRRYDLQGWTEADQEALDTWLDESLSHRTAYWRLKAIWTRADRLDALRPMSPPRPRSGVRSPLSRFKFAAAVALVSVVGTSAWLLSPPSMQTFATAIGERRDLTLPDGSHIELTTDTQLRLRGNAYQQNVWLDRGEAYFRVIHDPDREFVLHATKIRIVDLGTEFSVRRDSDRTQITVVSGSVRVEPADPQMQRDAIRLLPGEIAIVSNGAFKVAKVSPRQIADATSWRRGILVFDHMPLAKVASEFNRYNITKIRIEDAAISNVTISARLPATDVTVFARMAHEFLGLQVTRTATEIRISSRGT
jgi:transmembrane sensor